MQSRKQSIIEVVVGVLVGFLISYGSTFYIFPKVGIESSAEVNFIVVIFFTVVSIIRSYILRRFFNWWNNRCK